MDHHILFPTANSTLPRTFFVDTFVIPNTVAPLVGLGEQRRCRPPVENVFRYNLNVPRISDPVEHGAYEHAARRTSERLSKTTRATVKKPAYANTVLSTTGL
ncbi:uncharacterized protein CTRU02_214702 [Colletotrichum truncatum]|uniref:Uncharacterized protein n=1 Tax=Colletotrichum truncatum TaxID=5467 RepID=A0ACC3YFK1_COLTU|nr:uncharacterized protein CTRU02_09646 [Colletotrichum truncatum]KAF6788328.1 hypothetical protein CTRU02_09646 [Colletotrichum truncatum]